MMQVILKILLIIAPFLNCDNPLTTNPPDPVIFPPIDQSPVWSPDGQKIIYNHVGIIEIFDTGAFTVDPDSGGLTMVNTDGSNRHLLTNVQAFVPNWSPDGKWILYDNQEDKQIYRAPVIGDNLDISNIEQLTFSGFNLWPKWQPSGEGFVYVQSDVNSDRESGIWYKSFSAGNEKRLQQKHFQYFTWNTSVDNELLISTNVFSERTFQSGGQILTVTEHTGDSLWVYDINNDRKKGLAFLNGDYRFSRFTYSPDGTKIAYHSILSNLRVNIYMMDSGGNNIIELTKGIQPSWAPDGEKLVFISDIFTQSNNNGTVWTINIKTGEKKQLSFGPNKADN